MLKQRKGTGMPVRKSSKNSGGVFSWIFAVVVVTVAAIGVGWLIGQQVLNFSESGRFGQAGNSRAPTQVTLIILGVLTQQALRLT